MLLLAVSLAKSASRQVRPPFKNIRRPADRQLCQSLTKSSQASNSGAGTEPVNAGHVPGTPQKALPGHDWRADLEAQSAAGCLLNPAKPPDASWLFSASQQNEARL